MGIIENAKTDERIILHNQHTIGRDRNNICILTDNDVSRKHAVIYWENDNWFLTDFSTNGTKLNSSHIHHTTQKLKLNDTIQFSNSSDCVWKLTSCDKPNSFLIATLNSQKFIDLQNGVMFPEENPKWALFRDIHQRWIIDDGQSEKRLVCGEKFRIDNEEYLFVENECLAETQKNIDITKDACFKLILSNDEENVSAQIKVNDLILDLGTRAYNHLLLHLARVRMSDIESGVNENASGWIDVNNLNRSLSKEVLKDVDEYYINNLIYRLRKSLIDLPPFGHLFTNIVERKRGQLRFGLPNFKIEKEEAYA
jgi:hypothetical protein